MKLACADFSFPLLSHDQSLDVIAMLGLDGVDIGLFPNRSHLQPRDVIRNVPKAARRLKRKVQDRGLQVADVFLQSGATVEELAENHPDVVVRRRSRQLFLRGLEFAVRCEAKHMTTLPGIHWKTESPADSLKRCSDELAWRAAQAREAGVTYATEAHMWSVAPTPALAAKLARMTPKLTLTLDYGHYTTQGYRDAQIEPLWKFASHFHARASCKGLLQTTLVKNTIDFRRVVRAAQRANYRGYLGIEYVRMGIDLVPDVDNLAETVLLRDLLRGAAGRSR